MRVRATTAGADALVAGARFSLDAALPDVLTCAAVRRHGDRMMVRFEEAPSIEAVQPFVGKTLYAARADVPLRDGEYLDADLVGLALEREDGTVLGRVARVEHYPAQDCLVIDPGQGLVPLVRAFIRRIDVAGGRIVVDLPAGLLDPHEAEEA